MVISGKGRNQSPHLPLVKNSWAADTSSQGKKEEIRTPVFREPVSRNVVTGLVEKERRRNIYRDVTV